MTDAEQEQAGADQKRPAASAREIKALAHPLRLRILRLCGLHELTNKQLADRLGQDPGTMLYHVRQLLSTGFLEAAGGPHRARAVRWRSRIVPRGGPGIWTPHCVKLVRTVRWHRSRRFGRS